METSEPGLFELPDVQAPSRPEASPRGRNREIWVRTSTAEVSVTEPVAVREAWARADERGVTIAVFDAVDDEQAEEQGGPGADPIDILPWLIWPTEGMDGLLEARAVRVLEVSSEVEAEPAGRARLTWTLVVKITNVVELRRLAVEAHPEQEALITHSLEAAWNYAADPAEPLRAIPGIAWEAPAVEVRHMPAREFWASGRVG